MGRLLVSIEIKAVYWKGNSKWMSLMDLDGRSGATSILMWDGSKITQCMGTLRRYIQMALSKKAYTNKAAMNLKDMLI